MTLSYQKLELSDQIAEDIHVGMNTGQLRSTANEVIIPKSLAEFQELYSKKINCLKLLRQCGACAPEFCHQCAAPVSDDDYLRNTLFRCSRCGKKFSLLRGTPFENCHSLPLRFSVLYVYCDDTRLPTADLVSPKHVQLEVGIKSIHTARNILNHIEAGLDPVLQAPSEEYAATSHEMSVWIHPTGRRSSKSHPLLIRSHLIHENGIHAAEIPLRIEIPTGPLLAAQKSRISNPTLFRVADELEKTLIQNTAAARDEVRLRKCLKRYALTWGCRGQPHVAFLRALKFFCNLS